MEWMSQRGNVVIKIRKRVGLTWLHLDECCVQHNFLPSSVAQRRAKLTRGQQFRHPLFARALSISD